MNARQKAKRYRMALRAIVAVLGPNEICRSTECQGCEWEMYESLRTAREALDLDKRNPRHR